ncbi:MAG: AAA family ATPase [Bacteroidetes bacterium]|nr:AAA family ATPase [Bacteroidota bacterium]
MTTPSINALLLKQFNYEPTPGQEQVINQLGEFIKSTESNLLFILKGYAGTGKTTLVSALVKTLPAFKITPILLAPTGRAAKVLGNYSNRQALTIHKKIYKRKGEADNTGVFQCMPNLHSNACFIVDEASMIADNSTAESNYSSARSLLEDLLAYVREGVNCKIIFIGDAAQLPPVGSDLSPALDGEYLAKNFLVNIFQGELKQVVRQKQESGILQNATLLRTILQNDKILTPVFEMEGFKDIVRISGGELEDAINDAYGKWGREDTMIICRSNKRANIYNQQIRARILWNEEEISAGDLMMVVKNNYFWLPDTSKAGFVANGDIVEILKVKARKEAYGFSFADVVLRMADYPEEAEFEAKLLLNTISSESPSLNSSENKQLYEKVMEDYMHITNKRERFLKLKKDPFFNALQVKFAYAITCHKSQGGQWPCVFVEQGYLTKDMINREYIRWLYTAVSRASEKLYLVNFTNDFFTETLQE